MGCLIDTSILVRLANTNDPQRGLVFDSLAILHRRGDQFWIAPQSLVEFWNVATRPTSVNGLGLPIPETADLVSYFEADFSAAFEMPKVFETLKSIAQAVRVIGKQIHDARLVATCHVHGIESILTFNRRHFVRFTAMPPGLIVVDPVSISGSI
jgi:predicted nucleic acid-binding protein